MRYTPIIGSLGYILSPDKKNVLLVHRNARESDDHLGKYNGLGGKMESNEDIAACMKREIKEEANIDCTEMSLRGTINWTCFGPKGENWLGFIFLIHSFTGEPLKSNSEGDLEWIALDKIYSVPMWEGDKHFLPLVFDNDPRPFHGYLPYDYNTPLSWQFTRL
jgi:8-oxo-dGTP diphosphatase